VSRSSWTRTSATRTEWHTAGGAVLYQATGKRLFYLERELESLLFSPLPGQAAMDPEETDLNKDEIGKDNQRFSCVVLTDRKVRATSKYTPDEDYYCFDSSAPHLRVERRFTAIYATFDKLAKVQDRIVSGSITITDGRHKLLTFAVSEINEIAKNDAAIVPEGDAKQSTLLDVSLLSPNEMSEKMVNRAAKRRD
jgi:hypothetical protein